MRSPHAGLFIGAALVAVLSACGPSGGTIVGVTIDGGDRSAVVGDAFTLNATVATTGSANGTVTWNSSDDAIATIDANGTALALAEGSSELTAISTADPTKTDTVTLTVDPPGALLWTRQFGTTGTDVGRGIATDANGNLYVTGNTNGTLEGTNFGDYDAFVRAYDADGNVRWTRQFGTTGTDVGRGIATDEDGNLYVTGITNGTLEGTSAGDFDAFVRAYDADGNVRWTRQFGTTGSDGGRVIATDANGDLYVAGTTTGALDGSNAGDTDVFVRAYDADGNARWTRQFGTTIDERPAGIATSANGDLYVTGTTDGALDGSNAGGQDGFVRAYAADGTVRWTRQFGTATTDISAGIAIDANGDLYVTGRTAGELDGSNAGLNDAFVRAYDADGTVRWTRQFGTANVDEALGIATDANGDLYVTGTTGGALDGSNAGLNDVFVRALDADGNVRWTRQFGTIDDDDVNGIATNSDGRVHTVGSSQGALVGVSSGGEDAFVRTYGR